jgi:hypothetical protein
LPAAVGRGASLKATEQPIDTGTAAGKYFLDMLGSRPLIRRHDRAGFYPTTPPERSSTIIATAKVTAEIGPAQLFPNREEQPVLIARSFSLSCGENGRETRQPLLTSTAKRPFNMRARDSSCRDVA